MEALVHDLESGPVHASQQLHARVTAILALGHPHIEPAGQLEPGKYPVPKVMKSIKDLSDKPGILLDKNLPLQAGGPRMAPKVSPVHHILIRLIEEGVEMPDAGQSQLVDDEPRMMTLQGIQCVSVVRIDNERTLVKFLVMLVQPVQDFLQAHVLRPGVNPLQILIPDQFLFQLGSSLHTNLGVVLRNELLFVL